MRIFLIVAAILLARAVVPAVILAQRGLPHGQVPDGVQVGCETMIAVAVSLAGAAVLSSLLTIPAARKTDRCLDDFMTGNVLTEWTYAPPEWQAYIDAERRRVFKTEWVIFMLTAGVSLACALIVAWTASSTRASRLVHIADVLAGGAALAAIYFLLGQMYSRYHRAQLLKFPKAYIGRSAVFCGGAFAFWGADMRQLQSVRILAGTPPMLEVIVGYSATARATMSMVNAIANTAGAAAYTSDRTQRQLIPIPSGKEAEAQQIIAELTPPPPAPVHPAPGPHVLHAPLRRRRPSPRCPPRPWPCGGARRSWAVTAALFALGLVSFILVDVFDSGRSPSQPQSAATNTAALLGCALWLACLIFLARAIILKLKTRRAIKQA